MLKIAEFKKQLTKLEEEHGDMVLAICIAPTIVTTDFALGLAETKEHGKIAMIGGLPVEVKKNEHAAN